MFLEPFGSDPDCKDGMQCHSPSPLCAEDIKVSPKQDQKRFPPHPASGALICGVINVMCDSLVAQAGVFWGWASPPGVGESCWGLMQGTFSIPGACGVPPWPFLALESPLYSLSALLNPAKKGLGSCSFLKELV